MTIMASLLLRPHVMLPALLSLSNEPTSLIVMTVTLQVPAVSARAGQPDSAA
jgi:hypothetical protein